MYLIYSMFFSDKTARVEAPTFLKKIGDIEVFDGMKARFTACATGLPEPDVEWFKNGERIYSNERTKIEVEPNGNTNIFKCNNLFDDSLN